MKKTLVLTILAALTLAFSVQAQSDKDRRDARPNDYNDHNDGWDMPMSPFWAQMDDSTMPGRGGPGRFGRHGGRGPNFAIPERKHLEQFRMLKLLELLDLNDKQEVPFLTLFNDSRATTRNLQDQRRGLFQKLASGLHDSTITKDEINDLYKQIDQNDKALQSAREDFLNKARAMLTPYQFGKLVVFNERFEYELLERLREFRDRRTGNEPAPEDNNP